MRISAVVSCLVLAAPLAVAGQTRFNRATQVRSISFRVEGARAPDRLADQIATHGRGSMAGLRRAFRWVPLVPAVADRPFDPLEVQRDKERLRRYFASIGYPHAVVEYEVVLDERLNVVDIVFMVAAGTPLLVRSLTIQWADSGAGRSPAAARVLTELRRQHLLLEGAPLDERTIPAAAAALLRWLGDRGYPFGSVRPEIAVDSAPQTASVVLRADAGPRARIRTIGVEGNSTLSAETARRYLAVHAGDWFSASRVRTAAEDLATLDVVRSATIEIPRDQPVDTLVDVTLRVREEWPRAVTGQLGYGTDGGITGQGDWTHRYFGRGARTVTATMVAQSGALALDQLAEKEVRGGLTLRQPILGRPRLTISVGPFGAFRDDYRDRSFQVGLETNVVYQLGALSAISLRHELSTRHVIEYRFGDFFNGIDLLSLLQLSAQGVVDSLGGTINASTLTLSGSLGNLDAPRDPHRGFLIEPSLVAVVPAALSSTQYVTGNLRATAYLPVGGARTLALRLGVGKLIPFGKSVPPTPAEGLSRYFQLRDVLFTAGGMGDVRGWGNRMLGPKFPGIIIPIVGDTLGAPYAERYVPIGGFNRIQASVELRVPAPLFGKALEAHAFVDAGRVWTSDRRFGDSADPYGVSRLFWSPGVGVDYFTVIGAVRVDLAYKMNPSILDLAGPNEATQAIVSGTPLTDLPRRNGRRFQLHIGIGRRL